MTSNLLSLMLDIHLAHKHRTAHTHRNNRHRRIHERELPPADMDALLAQDLAPEQPRERGRERQRERAEVRAQRERVERAVPGARSESCLCARVRVRVRVRVWVGGLRPELEDAREEDRRADVRAAELGSGVARVSACAVRVAEGGLTLQKRQESRPIPPTAPSTPVRATHAAHQRAKSSTHPSVERPCTRMNMRKAKGRSAVGRRSATWVTVGNVMVRRECMSEIKVRRVKGCDAFRGMAREAVEGKSDRGRAIVGVRELSSCSS